eukprot:2409378-Rhodomonas_salina.1
MACALLGTLKKFKRAFLTRFKGTNEGDVNTYYLGGQLIHDHDSANRTITYRQSVYVRKVLQIYSVWDKPSVSMLLEAGMRLTKADSLSYVDPEMAIPWHHLPPLLPRAVHLKAAERVLQYLWGWFELGLIYSYPGPERRNILMEWVDSDYACDQDTLKSVTGYVLSLNNEPVSWKAKRQDCVTLSSAEAEYVTASMAGQEVVYLRAMLQGFGLEQCKPTVVWEDNAACMRIADNPVNCKFTRYINVRRFSFATWYEMTSWFW